MLLLIKSTEVVYFIKATVLSTNDDFSEIYINLTSGNYQDNL